MGQVLVSCVNDRGASVEEEDLVYETGVPTLNDHLNEHCLDDANDSVRTHPTSSSASSAPMQRQHTLQVGMLDYEKTADEASGPGSPIEPRTESACDTASCSSDETEKANYISETNIEGHVIDGPLEEDGSRKHNHEGKRAVDEGDKGLSGQERQGTGRHDGNDIPHPILQHAGNTSSPLQSSTFSHGDGWLVDDDDECDYTSTSHSCVSTHSHNSFVETTIRASRTVSNVTDRVSKGFAESVLKRSVSNPRVLLGWEIFVDGLGVGYISGLRTSHFFSTRFRLQLFNGSSKWVKLRRGQRSGQTFSLLRMYR